MRALRAAVLAFAPAVAPGALPGAVLDFTAAERAAIVAHGPWPAPVPHDPSNRASGSRAAAELGRKLFFDERLAHREAGSCASCHRPERRFADGLATARGAQPLHRNTPSLLNVALQRWFGWDGAGDSLWAQSLRPIVSPREMGSTILDTANLLAGDAQYRELFARAYALSFHELDAEGAFVLAGKALAAYQETLVTGRTPFDEFRDALADDDLAAAGRYPRAAQRGLRIFVGRGRCSVCHSGANFTDGQFRDIGITRSTHGGMDQGRYQGVQDLLASRYNLLGPYNDDAADARAEATHDVRPRDRDRGGFRVPSLRGIAQTAPYMHNGSLATLRDVIDHYSQLRGVQLTADVQAVLRPLNLDEQQTRDLLAFLNTLNGHD